MVKLTKNIKSKKQKIAQRQRKTKAARKRNNILRGGAGGYVTKWKDQLEFGSVNNENEKMLQISRAYDDKCQHNVYYDDLSNLFNYENFEINMNFTNNFYKHIYYDIKDKYAIDLRNKEGKWIKDSAIISYDITNYYINPTHENTTIVFLKRKTEPIEKVIKIFNNIPCNIDDIREYLSLEITHISSKSRNSVDQKNYMHYDKLSELVLGADKVSNTFNIFNFNHKKYYIPEVSEDNSHLNLSCRNADPINEYIINLIIGFINKNAGDKDKIRYVHYDNLFVTNVYTKKHPTGQLCWCLLMDKVDGSLDSLILKKYIAKPIPNEIILDYLTQAETMLKPLKTADYLFTHTDMKLENLFYKTNSDKVDIYLADLDKSSITFKGIRFYNDVTKNPNLSKDLFGVKISFDPVQGYTSNLKGDGYLIKTYNDRLKTASKNEEYHYRISRIGRVNPIVDAEFEQFYMRYNNQPYYTSFDIISLWLSILHFRAKDGGPIIDFNTIKNNDELASFLKNYMTSETTNLLADLYRELKEHYNGNFGLLLKPIYDRAQSQLDEIKFIHKYDETQPKLIRGLYLTQTNKIALSLPFAPTSIAVTKYITSFKPNPTATKLLRFYKENTTDHIKEFLSKLSSDNILQVTYSSDYSIAAERGELTSSWRLKPPPYILKTNRYSVVSYIYEWDRIVNEPVSVIDTKTNKEISYTENDIKILFKLFTQLSKSIYSSGRNNSN